MAVLVPKLVGLRAEVTSVAPNRDKESDGWVGNEAHSEYTSGHNPDESGEAEFQDPDNVDEVRAIDIDADLRTPGLSMEEIANYLRSECRAGRITWIHYIIYYDRIASATNNWAWRSYNGANNHRKHMHVSANLRGDTAGYTPVGLVTLLPEEENVDLTQDNLNDIGRTVATWDYVNGPEKEEAYRVALRAANNAEQANEKLVGQEAEIDAINKKLDAITQLLTAGSGNVDVAAILNGVKALLNHSVIAVEADVTE